MKKNNFIRILAIALVAMSIMAIAIPAMAASGTIDAIPHTKVKGESISFSSGSTVSFSVSCTLNSGDVVRVFLDSWDPGRKMWVERTSVKFQTAGDCNSTLSYTLKTSESKVRLRTYGYENNSGTLTVSYSH